MDNPKKKKNGKEKRYFLSLISYITIIKGLISILKFFHGCFN